MVAWLWLTLLILPTDCLNIVKARKSAKKKIKIVVVLVVGVEKDTCGPQSQVELELRNAVV